MALIIRILIGLALAAAGTFFVIKTRKIMDFFGPIAWADAKLGGGGTNLMYKLIGIVLIFTGFMVATNLWNAFLNATLGSLFGFQPQPGE
ncbi:hypothetical protein HY479_00180 [Candidatus Uhrbacteria bacterium]|nr:hypothetical protein [Candidatus Uhrbacteria bacterium]